MAEKAKSCRCRIGGRREGRKEVCSGSLGGRPARQEAVVVAPASNFDDNLEGTSRHLTSRVKFHIIVTSTLHHSQPQPQSQNHTASPRLGTYSPASAKQHGPSLLGSRPPHSSPAPAPAPDKAQTSRPDPALRTPSRVHIHINAKRLPQTKSATIQTSRATCFFEPICPPESGHETLWDDIPAISVLPRPANCPATPTDLMLVRHTVSPRLSSFQQQAAPANPPPTSNR